MNLPLRNARSPLPPSLTTSNISWRWD
jgi:hypothetical protein